MNTSRSKSSRMVQSAVKFFTSMETLGTVAVVVAHECLGFIQDLQDIWDLEIEETKKPSPDLN